jgi:hypothetical protein
MPNVKVQGSNEAKDPNDQNFEIKLFVVGLDFDRQVPRKPHRDCSVLMEWTESFTFEIWT